MRIFNVIKNVLSKKSNQSLKKGPTPTHWGRQEYGGKSYRAIYKEPLDLNNLSSRKGWITAYVKQNIEGIKLTKRKGSRLSSPQNISYKEI